MQCTHPVSERKLSCVPESGITRPFSNYKTMVHERAVNKFTGTHTHTNALLTFVLLPELSLLLCILKAIVPFQVVLSYYLNYWYLWSKIVRIKKKLVPRYFILKTCTSNKLHSSHSFQSYNHKDLLKYFWVAIDELSDALGIYGLICKLFLVKLFT